MVLVSVRLHRSERTHILVLAETPAKAHRRLDNCRQVNVHIVIIAGHTLLRVKLLSALLVLYSVRTDTPILTLLLGLQLLQQGALRHVSRLTQLWRIAILKVFEEWIRRQVLPWVAIVTHPQIPLVKSTQRTRRPLFANSCSRLLQTNLKFTIGILSNIVARVLLIVQRDSRGLIAAPIEQKCGYTILIIS